jgi:hypothetical protein
MRRLLVIYDFATAPCWISLYMRKILFSFLSVWRKQETKIKSSLVEKDWIQLENGIGKGEGGRVAAIHHSTHTSPPVQMDS